MAPHSMIDESVSGLSTNSHSTKVDSKRAVASIFNSAVAATAISTAWEIGLFDDLKTRGTLQVAKFAEERNYDDRAVRGLVSALSVVNVIARKADLIVPGELFEEAFRTKSLFHWLSIGSGELFSNAPYIFDRASRKGDFYNRDARAISYACRDINQCHFDPVFQKVLDGLDIEYRVAADLGCGSGERLMQVLRRSPNTVGVGIDIAQGAIEYAEEQAKLKGFAERLTFKQGDACELDYCEAFENVEILTCFLMGHDFWPREHCVATLRRLRRAFPNCKRLILGDTVRVLLDNSETREAVPENDVPTFTLGFEFGHYLMGVYLPTLEEWEDVFGEGGWRCVNQHLMESPSCSVIFELAHA